MKICAAQTRPIKGDVQKNIANHKKLIELAWSHDADVIIFPELSLTGYEPALAKALATDLNDSRFDDFQTISNSRQMTIGVGMPTKSPTGICISMLLFQPHKARQIYSKSYLHPDEEPFFVSGPGFPSLKIDESNLALAICYELSVPDHARMANKSGAEIYVASVAKSSRGVDQAGKRLSDIAKNYSMTVLMANCVGPADSFISAGKTSVWSREGILLAQLDEANEGVIVYDTEAHSVIGNTLRTKPVE